MKEYADTRMHTAEHLLNQTMVRLFNKGRAFSSHIEKKKSKCDYHFDRNLTPEEAADIQRRVNEIIDAGLPVSEQFMPRSEAEKRFDPSRLPQDASGDTLRVIVIGDYDACPCIGQHVSNTKEIGGFRIISTSHENNVLRIRFKLDNAD